ncbi:MAG TPA: hypothetical protein VIL11_00885, partial [Limnochordales bacterium]
MPVGETPREEPQEPGWDPTTLQLLDWQGVLERIASRAATPMGKERVQALRPHTRMASAAVRLQQVAELLRLLQEGGQAARLPLNVPDVRPLVQRLARGGTLGPSELWQLAAAAAELTRLGEHLRRHEPAGGETAAALAPLTRSLGDFSELVQLVQRVVQEDGTVRDDASPLLANLRARLRAAQERVQELLQQLLRSPVIRRALQEPVVTVREGRYVLPVRQEMRDALPGIVHDASASGATLFVEPFAVVEANNALRSLRAQETAEVERIARELSRQAARSAHQLARALEAAGEVDALHAAARTALEEDWHLPGLNERGEVRLRQARHPLLAPPVVPVDMELGDAVRVLVITGPNAGGKTVALKTLGLLCAMGASGLPIPAGPGSEVAVFGQVWADMGDPQSIHDQLSTFSGRIRRLLPVLEQVSPHTLVLLDEPGAGTDPDEGAALAMAVLDYLRERGARVVVTTHLTALKVLAMRAPRTLCGSVGFDVDRLQPTYRLQWGTAGASRGLEIAARLGVPEELLGRARAYLGPNRVQLEQLLAELHRALADARLDRERASQERAEAERMRQLAAQALQEAEARRARAAAEAREQASRWVRAVQEEARAIWQSLREAAARQQQEEVERLRARLRSLQHRAAAVPVEASPHGDQPPTSLSPGTWVWVEGLDCQAVVEETADDPRW